MRQEFGKLTGRFGSGPEETFQTLCQSTTSERLMLVLLKIQVYIKFFGHLQNGAGSFNSFRVTFSG